MNERDKLNDELAIVCYSVFSGSIMNFGRLKSAEERIKRLVDEGANPNIAYTDEYGHKYRPIILEYCAVQPMLEILLKNGGNPNFSDENGDTLAHYIVHLGGLPGYCGGDEENLRCLETLKNFGADISAVNKKNESILYAPRYGKRLSNEIISFALENGCKPMEESELNKIKMIEEKKREGHRIKDLRSNRRYYQPEDPLVAKERSFYGNDYVTRYKSGLKEKQYTERQNQRDNSPERNEELNKIQKTLFRHQDQKR